MEPMIYKISSILLKDVNQRSNFDLSVLGNFLKKFQDFQNLVEGRSIKFTQYLLKHMKLIDKPLDDIFIMSENEGYTFLIYGHMKEYNY